MKSLYVLQGAVVLRVTGERRNGADKAQSVCLKKHLNHSQKLSSIFKIAQWQHVLSFNSASVFVQLTTLRFEMGDENTVLESSV